MTGHVFTRITSLPKLGESWRDPSGLIWGDVIQVDGNVDERVKYARALNLCASLEARLPTLEEFFRLRRYLGYAGPLPDSPDETLAAEAWGYLPQILPHLNYRFWTSTRTSFPTMLFSFWGDSGDLNVSFFADDFHMSVRCVQ